MTDLAFLPMRSIAYHHDGVASCGKLQDGFEQGARVVVPFR
jgi:hypothetical protein